MPYIVLVATIFYIFINYIKYSISLEFGEKCFFQVTMNTRKTIFCGKERNYRMQELIKININGAKS